MSNWKIPLSERPRERAKQMGLKHCTDSELIAILLGTGGKHINVLDLAHQIVMDYPLNKMKDVTINELKDYEGMGEARSLVLLAAIELGQRVFFHYEKRIILKNKNDIINFYRPRLSLLDHEEMWICSLNVQDEVIGEHLIASGGVHSVTFDTALVYKRIVKDGAVAIILVHNHPSDNVTPSPNDDYITEMILEGSEYLRIKMIDHVIIGQTHDYSYREYGRLEVKNDATMEEEWLKDLFKS